MKTVVLIAGGKTNNDASDAAEHMYRGDLFKLSLDYARSLSPNAIFILSAKYGVLGLRDEIEAYDKSLKYMALADRRDWALRVKNRLDGLASLSEDTFVFLTGQVCGQYLTQYMTRYDCPLMGLQYGQQLTWLKAKLSE
ncbi:hypothetical protein KX729_31780 [Rhizobium sp. XQZ8]|uniref:DUF6884 domain-containing protein n=1 Tax=Rhizobium populisoli TaxID=2859785 RepID=UPI001CA58080|nr:DUF6884 domain-containing protein [Rhizobium populisoli]MBW6425967.1 hypothetical protein [Rhizobium populisoli]